LEGVGGGFDQKEHINTFFNKALVKRQKETGNYNNERIYQ
jgi:hypothetical protein